MAVRPELSEEEWELVIGLLQRERDELPSEIRRSRTSSYHDQLQRRGKMVQELLERLTVPQAVV